MALAENSTDVLWSQEDIDQRAKDVCAKSYAICTFYWERVPALWLWAGEDVKFLKEQPRDTFDIVGYLGEELAAADGLISLPEGHCKRLAKEAKKKKPAQPNGKEEMDVDEPAESNNKDEMDVDDPDEQPPLVAVGEHVADKPLHAAPAAVEEHVASAAVEDELVADKEPHAVPASQVL